MNETTESELRSQTALAPPNTPNETRWTVGLSLGLGFWFTSLLCLFGMVLVVGLLKLNFPTWLFGLLLASITIVQVIYFWTLKQLSS